MNDLIDISKLEDIPREYRKTPIGLLLEYHNLDRKPDIYSQAKLLIGMCMDHRKQLNIPDNFSYIIRTGGANLSQNEFYVSYAVAVGQIQHFALIGHNNCGMSHLHLRKDVMIQGLVESAGWEKERAEKYFLDSAPQSEIGDEVNFILNEVIRFRQLYPRIQIAPLMYSIDDNKLYLIKEA